jgi:hypothetical protein
MLDTRLGFGRMRARMTEASQSGKTGRRDCPDERYVALSLHNTHWKWRWGNGESDGHTMIDQWNHGNGGENISQKSPSRDDMEAGINRKAD